MAEFTYSPDQARTISEQLNRPSVIDWDETKQGRPFWRAIYKAFKALAEEEEDEFEDNIKLAIKSYQPSSTSSTIRKNLHIYRAIDQLCVWHESQFPQFLDSLYDAFLYPNEFDKYVDQAVERSK